MPRAAPRPCRAAGCGKLSANGYCEEHAQTGWAKRQEGRTTTERGYGASWRKRRAWVMARDSHLCQVCLELGRLTQATEVDHIKPKAEGGDDSTGNLRAICRACHRVKTNQEKRRGLTLSVPLTVVCGAPCSGKSTYIEQHRRECDTLIDLDQIIADMTGTPVHALTDSKRSLCIRDALRERDSLLSSAATPVWLVSGSPKAYQRREWRTKHGATVVLVDTPIDTCLSRAEARPMPEQTVRAVHRWFSLYVSDREDMVVRGY